MTSQSIESLPIGLPVAGIDPPVAIGRCSWARAGSTAPEDALVLLELYPGGHDSLTYFLNRDLQARCGPRGGAAEDVAEGGFFSDCGRPGISVLAGEVVLRLGASAGDTELVFVALAEAALDS